MGTSSSGGVGDPEGLQSSSLFVLRWTACCTLFTPRCVSHDALGKGEYDRRSLTNMDVNLCIGEMLTVMSVIDR